MLIAKYAVFGAYHAGIAKVMDTKKRFWACTAYIRSNPAGYLPLVSEYTDDGLKLLDGQHRLAALLALDGCISGLTLEVWIGSPPAHNTGLSESPAGAV